jgi:hypothetical protein
VNAGHRIQWTNNVIANKVLIWKTLRHRQKGGALPQIVARLPNIGHVKGQTRTIDDFSLYAHMKSLQ